MFDRDDMGALFLGVLYRWCVLIGCVVGDVDGAFEFYPVGAQAGGVGDVGVAQMVGAEGVFWNPAAVVFGKKMGIFLTADRPFGLRALDSQAISVVVKWGRHGVGGTYQGFGFDLYREQVFGGVYGYRISPRVGLGVRVRSLVVMVLGRENRRWMVFDLGVRVLLHESVWWGVSAWNVSGVRAGGLGQGGEMGVAVEVADDVGLFASVQKEAGLPTGFGVGIAHVWASVLTLRVGIGSQPERLSAGFGLQRGWLGIDYAGVWHAMLGVSHRVSVHVGR